MPSRRLEWRPKTIVALVIVGVSLVLILLYTISVSLRSAGPVFIPSVELDFVDMTEGWFVFEVSTIDYGDLLPAEARPTDEDLERAYGLSLVHIVLWDNGSVIDFPQKNITLAEAKTHFEDPTYNGNVTYNDVNGDDRISEEDLLMLRAPSNGGVFRVGHTVALNNYEMGVPLVTYGT